MCGSMVTRWTAARFNGSRGKLRRRFFLSVEGPAEAGIIMWAKVFMFASLEIPVTMPA